MRHRGERTNTFAATSTRTNRSASGGREASHFLLALLVFVAACHTHDARPASSVPEAPAVVVETREARLRQLFDDTRGVLQRYQQSIGSEPVRVGAWMHPETLAGGAELPARARALLAEDPSDETSFRLLVMLQGRFLAHWLDARARNEAIERHFDRAEFADLVVAIDALVQPENEPLLRRIAEEHTDRAVRGLALLQLAHARLATAHIVREIRGCADAPGLAEAREVLGESRAAELGASDPALAERDAAQLYERVERDYGDVLDWGEQPGGATLGDRARRCLFEIRELAIGRPAPEIEGEDLDGDPMTLSELRGKVVLLQFWTPSDTRLDQQLEGVKALHARLDGEPFEIVGVASDTEADEALLAAERVGIPWRSFRDDENDAISETWNTDLRATSFLIDADGIIRARDLCGETLAAAVDELVAKVTAR